MITFGVKIRNNSEIIFYSLVRLLYINNLVTWISSLSRINQLWQYLLSSNLFWTKFLLQIWVLHRRTTKDFLFSGVHCYWVKALTKILSLLWSCASWLLWLAHPFKLSNDMRSTLSLNIKTTTDLIIKQCNKDQSIVCNHVFPEKEYHFFVRKNKQTNKTLLWDHSGKTEEWSDDNLLITFMNLFIFFLDLSVFRDCICVCCVSCKMYKSKFL